MFVGDGVDGVTVSAEYIAFSDLSFNRLPALEDAGTYLKGFIGRISVVEL